MEIKQSYRKREKSGMSAKLYIEKLKNKEKALRKRTKTASEKFEQSKKELSFVTELVGSLKDNRLANISEIGDAKKELDAVREAYSKSIPALEAKVNQLMLLLDGG